MSLGVLVVEAGRKSGALITARQAVEEHGREVFALPGRIDSDSCAGSLDLLKMGGAQLVTEPSDIVQALEMPARHAHAGTHEDRYAPDESKRYEPATRALIPGGEAGQMVYEACNESRTLDQIGEATGMDMAAVGQAITLLEISGLVTRSGGKVTATR